MDSPQLTSNQVVTGCLGMIMLVATPFGIWKIAEIILWYVNNA